MNFSRREMLQLCAGTVAASAAPATPPNIVLIYADDLGSGDLGCYGSRLRTPNLDGVARDGARLTHFNSANPVCSPSRAALLTGRYPTRVGVPRVLFPRDNEGLPASEVTIASMLKGKGYQTMCVGKWHLGHKPDYLPTARGFDHYFGIPYSNDMQPRWLMNDQEVVEQTATLETLTPRYTEQAVSFIDSAKGRPFFLYMPHTYPHIPLGASDRFRGKSPLGIYGDVIAELDWSVGEILGALRRNGVEKNTLVVFSSDNGPWYQGSPGLLRGRKGMTWEGGVRVPMLARLPGRIPAGIVSDAVTSTMDILPTIAGLTGASLPSNAIDGIDIMPVLSGRQKQTDREALLYFDNVNLQCARWNQWKLHISRYNSVTYSPAPQGGRRNLPLKTPELYDLVNDPAESYDVAAENPKIVAAIQGRIERLIRTFPPEIQKAYDETKLEKALPTPAGQVTRAPV